jgi:hypothetical protein
MTKKFARHVVIPRGMASIAGLPISGEQIGSFPGSDANEETKMKNLATIVAAALILSSTVQFATAAPNHHQTKAQQTAVHQQRNNTDAYASWPAGRTDEYEPGPSYSGGYSAPAGR